MKTRLALYSGILAAIVGIIAGVAALITSSTNVEARQHLESRVDECGPVLIAVSERAQQAYGEAIDVAKHLHPAAAVKAFSPDTLVSLFEALAEDPPRYALVFLLPDELDVNLAYEWLTRSVDLDPDPFVDMRTGFITGETPEQTLAFMNRIRAWREGTVRLAGKVVDNLGANPQVAPTFFKRFAGSYLMPVLSQRLGLESITYGRQGFGIEQLNCMEGAGIIHFGGHGYPDRIVDSLNGVFVRKIGLSPAVVFNGACYTGVTGRWFDASSGTLQEKRVDPKVCFALGLLSNRVVAYLAALHPDHGIPVYQEMEHMAYTGASLGDILKHTYDAVVIGNGGRLPPLPALASGMPAGATPKEIMLKGTAARVLFGDPTMCPTASFTEAPFRYSFEKTEDRLLQVRVQMANPDLKTTLTNTFESDLSASGQFNDRIYAVFDLPGEWASVASVTMAGIMAPSGPVVGRVTGYAVEQDQQRHRLHVQVDVPSTAYLQGPIRHPDTWMRLQITR